MLNPILIVFKQTMHQIFVSIALLVLSANYEYLIILSLVKCGVVAYILINIILLVGFCKYMTMYIYVTDFII